MSKYKPWLFGKQARSLPVFKDPAAWVHSREENAKVSPHEASSTARRHPSRTVPENLEGLIGNPTEYLVTSRRDWDILKYARLYTGENYEIPATFEFALRDCWLHVPSGMVITKDKEVLSFSTYALNAFYEGHSDLDWSDAPWVEEPAFKLATVWGRNYAHWLMDALPKADALVPGDTRLTILDKEAPPFQSQSAELLGLKNLHVPTINLLRFRELHFVSSTRSGSPDPRPLFRIRKRLQDAVGLPHPCSGRRLYISRQHARRRIVNGEDVEKVLTDFGFEEIFTEEMSFADQVRIFSEAAAIFGAHGAGTMNVVFAPAGSSLIEVINPRVWDHSAHRVASLCGVNHYHLFAENVSPDFDIRVDPFRLERTLALALEDSSQPRKTLVEKYF